MLRLFSLSLSPCLVAGLWACDDGGVADPEPESEPSELVCSEIVLEEGRSAIARCPDGARFSWIVDGREVLTRVSSALVIGGVDVTGEAWPTVRWSFGYDRPEGEHAGIMHSGDTTLPVVITHIWLSDDRLTVRTTVQLQAPIYIDAVLPLTAGVDTSGVAIGLDGFEPATEVAPRAGAQLWLSPAYLSASAERPATIAGNGRIELAVDAEVSPAADLVFSVDWTINRLGQWARAGYIDPIVNPLWEPRLGSPFWGWRTGASHGAVVDAEAISHERDALLNGASAIVEAGQLADPGSQPWIVIDGLWAPALGDWRIDSALREATSGAWLGLHWPAAIVCPDAPAFDQSLDERLPTASACGELDPNLPAARDRVKRSRMTLRTEGVNGFWLPSAAFANTVLAVATETGLPSSAVGLDRVMGTPGADCLEEALYGPFPRSTTCGLALRTLEAPAAAPQVDPIDGARVLMAHLDLNNVSPLALTLTGLPSEARQRLGLAALGGGPMLIADAPSAVASEAWDWLAAVRQRPDAFLATPRLTADDWPPSRWDGDASRIIFNFTDAPVTAEIDPEWIGTRDLFDPEIEATAQVSIPPNDVRVFVRPAQ